MDASHLSPRFVIPRGTQVVLKKDLPVIGPVKNAEGEHVYKKHGSVGEVLKAPFTNDYTYLVQFADGLKVRAKKVHLAVRRALRPAPASTAREIEAFEEYVIYKVCVGSRAFGLANDASDVDERGVYLPPAEWHWSLQPVPQQLEFKRCRDGEVVPPEETDAVRDVCWWELEKFLTLALKANPNVLEVLFVGDEHVLYADKLGRELREIRGAFLSKHLYQTYSGYVLSQFRLMRKQHERGKPFRSKHAMHLIRLLHSGIEALKGRGILVDVGCYREELLTLRDGGVSFDEVYARALELDAEFQQAFAETALPERPDVARVDEFLIKARRSRAGL